MTVTENAPAASVLTVNANDADEAGNQNFGTISYHITGMLAHYS